MVKIILLHAQQIAFAWICDIGKNFKPINRIEVLGPGAIDKTFFFSIVFIVVCLL